MMRYRRLLTAVRNGAPVLKATTVAVPVATVVVCWVIGWHTVKAYEVFIIASVCILAFNLLGLYVRASVEGADYHRNDFASRADTNSARPHNTSGAALGFMLLSVVVAGVLFSIGWVMMQVMA